MIERANAFFITHPSCIEHHTGDGHPESHHRLQTIVPILEELLPKIDAPLATIDELLSIHSKRHIDHVLKSIPDNGYTFLDGDTVASPHSGEAALRAAGAALHAVDLILDNKCKFVFNAVRPPGHHATQERHGGFCFFNNVALAALHALNNKGLKRVAIIDPDVHHGNGTQDIMWKEERCLFCSTHQSPLFPYTGSEDETGEHNNILNRTFSAGQDGAVMRATYESEIFPRIKEFKPDMIFISAGFDAHILDPLANLEWSTDDFGWLAYQIKALADELCEGRVMATLEGGYDLDALAASVMAFVKPFIKAI